MSEKSCVGCKFLFYEDIGYSNYTVTDTVVDCAKSSNPNLPQDEPFDWKSHPDNWPATKDSRCDLYAEGESVILDVDGEDGPEEFTNDREVIDAIYEKTGYWRKD